MPISSTVDYIPTMDEFKNHWAIAEELLVFSLPENGAAVTIDNFSDLRDELDAAKTAVQARLNDLESSRVSLLQLRGTAGDRIAEFNRRIRAEFPNGAQFNRLPDVPNRTGGRDAFLDAMDDALDLWTKANALPATPTFIAPLLLAGGLTRAQFLTMRTALDAAFTARGTAENALDSARISRNTLQTRAYALMKQYRLTVEARFAPDSLTVQTLPRLTPAPGNTPDPVTLAASWSPSESKAELEWTESEDADLENYQVRAVPGPEYESEDETVIATIPPDGPRVFLTAAGLAVPGAAMSYKVYVRLTTGNEAGSEAVTVTRPG